jgi:hypothetical protein
MEAQPLSRFRIAAALRQHRIGVLPGRRLVAGVDSSTVSMFLCPWGFETGSHWSLKARFWGKDILHCAVAVASADVLRHFPHDVAAGAPVAGCVPYCNHRNLHPFNTISLVSPLQLLDFTLWYVKI